MQVDAKALMALSGLGAKHAGLAPAIHIRLNLLNLKAGRAAEHLAQGQNAGVLVVQ